MSAAYFDDVDFASEELQRVDPVIDFDWAVEQPRKGMPAQCYSVRWTGHVEPRFGETYSFILEGREGARLWVDGKLVIDAWLSIKKELAQVNLEAGKRYDIRLELVNRNGNGAAHLAWFSASQPREIVPSSQLYPVQPVLPTFTMSEVESKLSESAKRRRFVVRRTGGIDEKLLLKLELAGDAVAGSDYRLEPQTVELKAGSDSASFTIEPIEDAKAEPDKLAQISVPVSAA